MTDHYRYLEPFYNAWRRLAYSAATWTVVTAGLGYLAAEYAAEGAYLLTSIYALLTIVGVAGLWYNAQEGNWL